PYLSHFQLIGTDVEYEGAGGPQSCQVREGAQTIDQRVPVAVPGQDYMTTEDDWFHVQNGANVRDDCTLFDAAAPRRFIATPRDLATYVHDDALYQAYLNACLILLAQDAPLDPAFDRMVGRAKMTTPAGALERNATGFALFGGPHILTLVTEVATRALKAVRFQKYNVHLRLRPETLGGRLVKHADIKAAWPIVGSRLSTMAKDLGPTFNAVRKLTAPSSTAKTPVYLPMAFQEGSPMHPAYGAGHATVAGACVTVLKAFFDTGAQYLSREETRPGKPARQVERFRRPAEGDAIRAYAPAADGATLDDVSTETHLPLTLEGELNKLCANISIGRNMGGVHYFSDYYDSARMGEAIAIGMLEEQALCYAPDRFVLSLPTFDGEELRIGRA
ncbi:MAG: vanadium-dependent haloperoxidase, partial [Pseudomonadota bacterium]